MCGDILLAKHLILSTLAGKIRFSAHFVPGKSNFQHTLYQENPIVSTLWTEKSNSQHTLYQESVFMALFAVSVLR